MPHTTQSSYDAPPHLPRSSIHVFTVTFCITFVVTFFTLLIVLSFLDPAFLFFLISSLAFFVSTVTSSLAPIILFIIKTSAKLLALYLFYSLAQATHLSYHMKKRQDERQRHQEQVFGHAKMYFVDE
jgi:membrane protein implicated in regulation of membrane protease activity